MVKNIKLPFNIFLNLVNSIQIRNFQNLLSQLIRKLILRKIEQDLIPFYPFRLPLNFLLTIISKIILQPFLNIFTQSRETKRK